MDFKQFLELYLLILKNQTGYYRQVYKGKEDHKINLQKLMLNNQEDIRRIYELYDLNKNGFIDLDELRELFLDLGLDIQFADSENPEKDFEDYLLASFDYYDRNGDGFIAYEEFIKVYNDLIDL